MCGRTAQTVRAVQVAAAVMGAAPPKQNNNNHGNNHGKNNGNNAADNNDDGGGTGYEWGDNYNLSPGMDAMVMRLNADNGKIETVKQTWGLITRGGTSSKPIAEGMSKHFESLMFNARSDTLWDKATFSGLLQKCRTCLVAVDGFYEWKTELGNQKQPYFVYRNNKSGANAAKPYLLFAGLWTSVQTGRSEAPTLDTFTVLTTEVCDNLKWLHTRMPVCVWDDTTAEQWLRSPTRSVHKQLVQGAQASSQWTQIQWHAVSPQMSSLKYRDVKAMSKIAMTKSVKSFFAVKKSTKSTASEKECGSAVESRKKLSSGDASATTTQELKNQKPPTKGASLVKHMGLKRPPAPKSTLGVPTKKPRASNTTPRKAVTKGSIRSFFSPKPVS